MSRRKVVLSEPEGTLAAINNDARPRRPARDCLKPSVLEELWLIWRADPRVPSLKSRRLWAISRDANPRLVDSWFLRRKTYAKKAGKPIPDGSYHLPLELPTASEREQSTALSEHGLTAISDLPSDDTLVYTPDVDDLNNLDASSDTVFDEDMLTERKWPETPAYTNLIPRPRQHYYYAMPEPSSTEFHAAKDRDDKHIPLFENPSSPVCDQSWGGSSNVTRALCSSRSVQDAIQPDSRVLSSDLNWSLSEPCSSLDSLPPSLSELSAIPYLFRTPSVVLAVDAISHSDVDRWTVVEDELGRLVNDGKLDFSFLDAPHFTSMELIG